MRLYVNASELRRLSASTAADASGLDEIAVPELDSSEVGHHRLADALAHFEATAEVGVAQLAKATQALSDWMLLAAEVVGADDANLAAEYRAQGYTPAPTQNRGAEAASGGVP